MAKKKNKNKSKKSKNQQSYQKAKNTKNISIKVNDNVDINTIEQAKNDNKQATITSIHADKDKEINNTEQPKKPNDNNESDQNNYTESNSQEHGEINKTEEATTPIAEKVEVKGNKIESQELQKNNSELISSDSIESKPQECNGTEETSDKVIHGTINTALDKENKESDQEVLNKDEIKSNEPKEENIKPKTSNFLAQNKKIICACVATAIVSSITTTAIVTKDNQSNPIQDRSTALSDLDTNVMEVGQKLEKSKLIETNSTYSLTHTFDSRFDNYRDNILDIYTTILDSDETLQEVYIIKNNDPKKVEENLNIYKENILELYKNKSNSKNKISIAKNAVIRTVNDVTYFVASEKYKEIDNLLKSELN